MSESAGRIAELLKRTRQLYSLPAVAIEVLSQTNDPAVDAARLKTCIEHDPALTAKVLRVVNSSLFGLSRQVLDLSQALGLLGIKPLKLLVLGFSLPEPLFAGIAGDLLGRFWKRSLTRAVAASEISQRLWHRPGDEAFIAGLLTDLGQLVLIQGLGRPYVSLLRRALADGADLAELEHAAMGFDHRQLTAGLLSDWGLPGLLIEAVSLSPSTAPEAVPTPAGSLSQVLHLAELMTRLLADGQRAALKQVLVQCGQRERLDAGELSDLVNHIGGTVSQLADVLSLELPRGLDYRDILVQAHEQLSVMADEAAGRIASADRRSDALNPSATPGDVQEVSRAIQGLVASMPADTQTEASDQVQPWARPSMRTCAQPQDAPIAVAEVEPEPRLASCLLAAAATCRRLRQPLSLILIELDHVRELTFSLGQQAASQLIGQVKSLCQSVAHPNVSCVDVGDARWAVILPDCERRLAVELASELVEHGRALAAPFSGPLSLSAGASSVTLPPRNFVPDDLVDRAERCLYGAQRAGGNCLKSIEL